MAGELLRPSGGALDIKGTRSGVPFWAVRSDDSKLTMAVTVAAERLVTDACVRAASCTWTARDACRPPGRVSRPSQVMASLNDRFVAGRGRR